MYSLAVQRDFVAQHFLIGGDWGAENEKHSHHYRVEIILENDRLDQHGYLVDIVDVEAVLNGLVAHFRDKTLNELPEFEGLNPSIEHFARIFSEAFLAKLTNQSLAAITVKIWENDIAWTSYKKELR